MSDVIVLEAVAAAESELHDFWVEDETMRVNLGPQHPSTHGVLRLPRTEVLGEVIVNVEPIIGYLHTRGYREAGGDAQLDSVRDVVMLAPTTSRPSTTSSRIAWLSRSSVGSRRRRARSGSGCSCVSSTGFRPTWSGSRPAVWSSVRCRWRRSRSASAKRSSTSIKRSPGLRMNHAYFRPGGVNMDLRPEHIADGA